MSRNEYAGLLSSDNGQKVSLQGITVNVVIGHMIGHVECVLLYKNTRPNAIETLFKFPLDEGSAIYKMEAEIDGKVIVAECQEKLQAQQTYDTAKAAGMTAFLLKEDDNSGDIFTCYLGNLPSQKEARLTIAYVSELTQESDGSIKFTLPTVLYPRYQSSISQRDNIFGQFSFGGFQSSHQVPNESLESGKGDYFFSLNIDIQSQFTIGSLTSETPEVIVQIQEPDRTRAKASYSTEKCNITTDVSLLIQYENNNQPTAIIERGSRGQDGLMKSDMLLLNFYPEVQDSTRKSGEFIFVIDRSGSMAGSNILNAVQTLMLLVKSMRVACYFNIVSFGSHYDQLFDKSVVYNKENMTTAVNLINRMEANMGGTELASPLSSVFSQPLIPDHPRQLFVITDGAINNVNQTLDLVKKNSKNARVFSVGIGQGASTALVKGLARAGNGRYQFVSGEDRLQQKVMTLMKFSLQPEVKNLKLNWTLSQGVSAVTVPQQLPNLFVGEMITLYAIITGAERQEIVGGTINMTGQIGEDSFEYLLEFEGQGHIDDTTVAAPIHRLAAKALVKDLEIEEMASNSIDKKSEIVLASVSANIISKYTSFVGVDKESKVILHQTPQFEPYAPTTGFMFGCAPVGGMAQFGGTIMGGSSLFGSKSSGFSAPAQGVIFGGMPAQGVMPPHRDHYMSHEPPMREMPDQHAIFGGMPPAAAATAAYLSAPGSGFGGMPPRGPSMSLQGSGFGGMPPPGPSMSLHKGSGFGSRPKIQAGLFGSAQPQTYTTHGNSTNLFGTNQPSEFGGSFQRTRGFGGQPSNVGFGSADYMRGSANNQAMLQDEVIAVISLQDFEGSWEYSEQLSNLLKLPSALMQPPEGIGNYTHWMTCLVLVWLEFKHSNRKDEWELLSKKASDWLISEIGTDSLAAIKTHIFEQMKQL